MLVRLPVMLGTTLLFLAAVVMATPSDVDRLHGIEPRSTGRECDTADPTPEETDKQEKAFASLLAADEAGARVASRVASSLTIPVRFNVIYAKKDISGGYVS